MFRIRFYKSRPADGKPGEIAFEQTTTNLERLATGKIIFVNIAPHEYLYSITLENAFHAIAGEQYWLECVQVG